MAIHDNVPGLKVTVRCNAEPLQEFEDPNAHDDNDAAACPLTTKYIECIDDAEFDVKVQVSSHYQWGYRNHVLAAATYVDGKFIQEAIIRRKETDYNHRATRYVTGLDGFSSNANLWSVQKFKFAAVKTIDDAQKERIESDLKVAKTLGTIEVRFSRVIEEGIGSVRHADALVPRSFELAEKSLKGKAVSHGTSYGVCQATPAPTFITAHKIKEDNGPILIIRFMYRSRDALKRELIIPRSPSRSPALENLTPAERDRLARERLGELRKMKMKREGGTPTIKREFGEVVDLTKDPPKPRATKKTRLEDGRQVDLIDLTDS